MKSYCPECRTNMKEKRYYRYNLKTGQIRSNAKSISKKQFNELSIEEQDKYVSVFEDKKES
jgi:hypothetical protein